MTDHDLIANLHRRMDSQDKMLLEIRDHLTKHVAESEQIRPALDELVVLWRGSKIIVPALAAFATAAALSFDWLRAHMK